MSRLKSPEDFSPKRKHALEMNKSRRDQWIDKHVSDPGARQILKALADAIIEMRK